MLNIDWIIISSCIAIVQIFEVNSIHIEAYVKWWNDSNMYPAVASSYIEILIKAGPISVKIWSKYTFTDNA